MFILFCNFIYKNTKHPKFRYRQKMYITRWPVVEAASSNGYNSYARLSLKQRRQRLQFICTSIGAHTVYYGFLSSQTVSCAQQPYKSHHTPRASSSSVSLWQKPSRIRTLRTCATQEAKTELFWTQQTHSSSEYLPYNALLGSRVPRTVCTTSHFRKYYRDVLKIRLREVDIKSWWANLLFVRTEQL
jgi:hypothetical protein